MLVSVCEIIWGFDFYDTVWFRARRVHPIKQSLFRGLYGMLATRRINRYMAPLLNPFYMNISEHDVVVQQALDTIHSFS